MNPTSPNLVWQQVYWPVPLDTALALGLIRRLAADLHRHPVIWETRSSGGRVSHLLGTAAHQVNEITELLQQLVPGASTGPLADTRPRVARSARLRVKGHPLHLITENAPQTARNLLAALTGARHTGESAVLQVFLGRGTIAQPVSGNPSDPTQSWFDLLARGARKPSNYVTASMKHKAAEPGFTAVIRVSATAKSEPRRIAIMQGVLAALRTLQSPGTQIDFVADTGIALDEATAPRWASLRLSSSEVLNLLAWPLEASDLPGLPDAHPKSLRLLATNIETVRTFAKTSSPGQKLALGVGITDALLHTVALGPTGSGKSTALLNLIIADLKAGRSVVVIDPKSDLVTDVLERIPANRTNDVVVLDPPQTLPVGINPLHVPGTSPELIADGILNIFRDLFPSAFGPRTSDVMHASLLTLAQHKGSTLTWLPRLLTDRHFRAELTGQLHDPDGLDLFWAQYSGMSERQQVQFIGPVLSRLRQFLLRPSLKRVLDQAEPKFQLADIFSTGRILLVPLNTGLLGNDAAKLLGSLLVSQLWQLTLARAATPARQRTVVSIYVDEAQEFLHLADISDALARSRSLGVAWHLAHQYREQLPANIRAAIDTNTLNKIVFGLGVKDAREMAAMTTELTAEDFMALPQFGIYASLVRHGRRLGWVSGTASTAPPRTSKAVDIIAASQIRYGRSPAPDTATSDATSQSTSTNRPDTTIGRRRRGTP